jgi:predicted permease
MGPIRRLFRLGLGRPTVEQSVDWEIEHYLQEQTDRLVEQGMGPAQARREAERRFGDVVRQKRKIMAVDRRRVVMRKRGEFWDTILTAVRQAFRGIRRAPGLGLAVVLTLGLGVGANAAMFGVVDRILLRAPDHVVEPDMVRRVFVEGEFFGQHSVIASTTYPDVLDLRTIPEFSSVGAVTGNNPITLGGGEDARQIMATRATHDFLSTLGVQAQIGRLPGADDDRIGAAQTAVVSYEFWQASLGGDEGVLGRTLRLSGNDVTVIGVAPEGFTGIDLEPVDVWLTALPAQYAAAGTDRFLESRGYWWLQAVVRLEGESGREAAEAQATAMHVNSRADRNSDPDARVLTAPLIEAHGPSASDESRVTRWVTGVALILLLIACANVANLLLAQGAGRKKEVAVRLSLGVSRGRLLREMVLETLLLAVLGGVVALAVAHWGGDLIRAVLLPDVLWTTSPLGGRVLALTAALSLAAGLLAGVGPAVQSTRADLARDLAEGGRANRKGRSRVRGALTVAQATLSVVLLVGAGLFVRSVFEVRNADLGLDVDRLVQASLEFRGESVDELEATEMYAQALEAVRRVPGVTYAAGTDMLFQWASIEHISVPGLDSLPVPPGAGPFAYGVTPGYMRTMGLRLIQGRPVLDTDTEGSPLVAVVNKDMADAFWPGQSPLGQCFHIGDSEECTSVVGVVEVASRGSLEREPLLAYHLPLAQTGQPPAGLYVRTDGDPREVAAELAPVLRSFSSRVRFAQVQTFRDLLGPQTRSWTLGASLFAAFGFLALVVAAIGLYSVLAFDVAQRTRELGIRGALGARRTTLLRSVMANGIRLAVFGVVIGLAVSLVAAPYVQQLLFRVKGRDPLVLGTVASLLVLVALVASFGPGLRATRVDPMEALRAE